MKNLDKTFVRQMDQTDCGVACLLSIIKFYGGSATLESLRKLSGTNRQGTTMLGLYQAASGLGFEANGCEATMEALIDHGAPVILHVILEQRIQHYVVCYGFRDGMFTVGDPAKGITHLTVDELNSIWKSKTCLTLSPNKDFVKSTTTVKIKKAWLRDLIKDDLRLLTISAVIGVVIAVLGMSMAIFSKKLIDDILPSNELERLIVGIGLLTFLLLARVAFTGLREYFLIQQSKDFNNRIVDNFYTSLLHLPKPFFDTRKIGELVARLNDTSRIQRVIKYIASNVIIDFLTSLAAIFFLYYYSFKIGLIATIGLPLYWVVIFIMNKKIINAQKEVMQGYAYSESNYINSIQGISSIKNNNKQNVFREINRVVYGSFQEKEFVLGKLNIKLMLLSNGFGVLLIIGILSFASYQVFNTHLTLGELMAILSMMSILVPAISNLALVAIPLNEAKIAFDRMFEFAAMEKEPTDGQTISVFEELEVKNLSFRFPGQSQLLKHVNLSVKKGEVVAIVGESGSGKSTLRQIIQKFLNHEQGDILINEKFSLRKVSLNNWRNIIGVVPQEVELFNGTVLDNILMGEPYSEEKVTAFMEQYSLKNFISSFPQGLATIIGEGGSNLSGGQCQIIAVARALYKQPQLLILDEATSAMDRKTEKFILSLLQNCKNSMGIITISHRLHNLKHFATRIYVLEDGVIKNHGNHQELLENKNFYSDFWLELDENITMLHNH